MFPFPILFFSGTDIRIQLECESEGKQMCRTTDSQIQNDLQPAIQYE